MQNHPQIAELYKLYLSETQPFRKVHRLIDLFESIIKTHTVLIVSEYVQHNKLSEAAKGLLAQGLRTPSLGTWQLFSRVLFSELAKEGFNGFFPSFEMEFVLCDQELYSQLSKGKIEFSAFDKKQIAELKKQKKKRQFFFDDVIAFRNGIAHGATPNDEDCLEDIKKFDPYLHQLLEMQWLKDSALRYKNSKVFMSGADSEICLHPLLVYKDEGDKPPFAFFNDLKNDKIGLLNYPLSKHYREKDFWNEFHEYLPLHDWKKTGNNEFFQRIEELTETFKGRTLERAKLLTFVKEKNKGYCSVQGNPGIGKSALIAQFFKDLKADEETKDLNVIEYFIRRVSDNSTRGITLLSYLNRKTDEVFKEAKEIFADSNDIWDVQAQLFKKWHLYGEKATNPKLVILIDGIDEAAEKDLISFIPKENFNNILFIYGSRPDGHANLTDLWTRLPVENHKKLLLGGLSKEDIRALIYEVSNKYEIEKDSLWIDLVLKKSEGNPLYLKLLCDGLSNGDLKLNDANALPKEIFGFYKGILDRYARNPKGAALLKGLYTFAAAKDYITEGHLKHINKLDEDLVHLVLSTLQEVLCENPLTENVLDYQLFHESFREYLYKEKGKQVQDASERIIDFCSGWNDLEASYEQRYALEHYAPHLSESKKEARIAELIALSNNESYIRTQKKVLKSFAATNKLYKLSLLKASDNNDYDAQLESALSLVDLKYEEANDAPQIIEMVANGEIDLALKRIESFGGNDKGGLQRKFILYMLCLMELTLLDSKHKTHRKKSIERLLNDLDEKMPVDHSVLNWNDFFPSYLMFEMACECADLGLDYLIVYRRTEYWKSDWIKEMGPYTELQFDVLSEISLSISDEYYEKYCSLKYIAVELAKQGKLEEALAYARGISDDLQKSFALKNIAAALIKQGQVQESLVIARGISDDLQKSSALKNIAVELSKQSQVQESSSVMQESLDIARSISNNWQKSSALKEIAVELSKQNQVEESLSIARGISSNYWMSCALTDIAVELSKQDQVEESKSVMQESLAIARGISDGSDKSRALKNIAVELSKQGQLEASKSVMQESLAIARGISDGIDKRRALEAIAVELSKQGQVQQSLAIARGISDDMQKSFALMNIAAALIKQGQVEESLAIARGISDDLQKSFALKNIAAALIKQGQVQESLVIARGISDDLQKSSALKNIAVELSKQSQVQESSSVMQESLDIARGISNNWQKRSALKEIAVELSKQNQVQESLAIARGISDDREKNSALKEIAVELSKLGQLEASKSVMQESLAIAQGISDDYWKSSALKEIAVELIKQGKIEESLAIARGIKDGSDKSRALKNIAVELSKLGQVQESASVMQESLAIAQGISDDWQKSSALKHIAVAMSKLGQVQESASLMQKSLAIAQGINDGSDKSRALKDIAVELSKQGQLEASKLVMQESLAIARGISDDREKSRALKHIAIALIKQGKIEESLAIARGINDGSDKSRALKNIAVELSKLSQVQESASVMQESLAIAQGISDDWQKSSALKEIAVALSKQGQLQKSLAISRGISDDWQKSRALEEIAVELSKLGQVEESASVMQESLEIARGISDDWKKSECLKDIAVELFKQGNYTLSEQTGLEIPLISERQSCWKSIAKSLKETHGWEKSLELRKEFKSEEAILYYLKGWAESISLEDMSAELIQKALPILLGDRDTIEHLMQLYSIHQLFFENPTKERINRYNRSLNIQWALDIKAQFPKDITIERRTDNLEDWIGEIEDEDEQEQIQLWAKQVRKGKMTEAEFGERVKEYFN